MEISIKKLVKGYAKFRTKYTNCETKTLATLMDADQRPEVMIISCCDSRVDPGIIFECNPGDLFTVRNIASIVPPYEKDKMHHGTSAALEFGIKFLQIKHIIIIGHSNCGGIRALMNDKFETNDFISNWLDVAKEALIQCNKTSCSLEECIKLSLEQSEKNCLTFPWIKERVENGTLTLHRWYFNLQTGKMSAHNESNNEYIDIQELNI